MIVCVCRRVSDREIIRFAKAGLDFDNIQFELGVATQCGRCEDCAREIVAQCLVNDYEIRITKPLETLDIQGHSAIISA